MTKSIYKSLSLLIILGFSIPLITLSRTELSGYVFMFITLFSLVLLAKVNFGKKRYFIHTQGGKYYVVTTSLFPRIPEEVDNPKPITHIEEL